MYWFRAVLLVFLFGSLAILAGLYRFHATLVPFYVPGIGYTETPLWMILLTALAFGGMLLVFVGVDAFQASFRWKEIRHQRAFELGVRGVQEAQALLANGFDSLAVLRLKEALRQAPFLTQGYVLLGNLHRRMGNVAAAIETHTQGLRLATDKAPLLVAQIQDFEEGDEPKAAERTVRELQARLSPGNIAVLAEQRRLWTREGRFEEALAAQRTIIKHLHTSDPVQRDIERGLMSQLARTLMWRGDYRQATGLLRRVLRESPAFAEAHIVMADLHMARGRHGEALESLDAAYGETKDPALLEHFYALAAQCEVTEFDTVRQHFAGQHRTEPALFLQDGRYLFWRGRHDAARHRFEALEEVGFPIPEIPESLASILELESPPPLDRVVRLLRKALEYSRTYRANYLCAECGFEAERWRPDCPGCDARGQFRSTNTRIFAGRIAELRAEVRLN